MFKSRKIKKNPQSELKLTDANTDISWDNQSGLNQCIIGYWQFKFKKMIYEKLQYI